MRASIWLDKCDPSWDFVVNKPFRFAGVDYEPAKPGEPENPFDVHTSPRQLRILYDSRFIRRAEPIAVEVPLSVKAVDPEAVAEHLEEKADQIKGAVAEAKIKPPELVKKSGGWYDVIGPDGKKLNEKALRIEAAGRLLKKASRDLDV